ncbi:MAG TPA: (2Fe-2S)-binding protein [Nitrososphaerales archaeon]|nr:(2Fe-2S)-binding protein [Nitrososphaerales archaeon]
MLNGRKISVSLDPGELLNYVIRERLGLIGTKRGCETGGCGSCTVIVDGKAVYSCIMYAMQVSGKRVTTIEGLQNGTQLDPLQESFMDHGGLQCGFCTTGFIMSSKALLDKNRHPTELDVRDALVGNLCRCTGYKKIFDSVLAAARNTPKSN